MNRSRRIRVNAPAETPLAGSWTRWCGRPRGENARRILLPRRIYQLPPPQDRSPPVEEGEDSHSVAAQRPQDGAQVHALMNRRAENFRTPERPDDSSDSPLWRSLLNRFAGVSPTLAREAAWRATGDANAPATQQGLARARKVLSSLWSLADTGAWTPTASSWTSTVAWPRLRPIRFIFCGEFVQTDSVSAAVAAFYAAQERDVPSSRDEYAGMRGGVAALIRQAQARVQRQLRALSADEPAPGEPERVRTQAQWLLALSSQIMERMSRPDAQEGFSLQDGLAAVTRAPNGQMQLVVWGAADSVFRTVGGRAKRREGRRGAKLTVPLDPKRSPVEQAERMFDRAAKLERAARFIPRRRAGLEADQAYLQQLESDLSLAQNQPEIVAVREALRAAGYLRISPRSRPAQNRGTTGRRAGRDGPARRDKAPADRSQPLRYLSPEGFPILVGRNARQNEIVTFTEAGRDDLWLHVRDGPGAHVVIRCGGQPAPASTRRVAAQLAAWFSAPTGGRRRRRRCDPGGALSRAWPAGGQGRCISAARRRSACQPNCRRRVINGS